MRLVRVQQAKVNLKLHSFQWLSNLIIPFNRCLLCITIIYSILLLYPTKEKSKEIIQKRTRWRGANTINNCNYMRILQDVILFLIKLRLIFHSTATKQLISFNNRKPVLSGLKVSKKSRNLPSLSLLNNRWSQCTSPTEIHCSSWIDVPLEPAYQHVQKHCSSSSIPCQNLKSKIYKC